MTRDERNCLREPLRQPDKRGSDVSRPTLHNHCRECQIRPDHSHLQTPYQTLLSLPMHFNGPRSPVRYLHTLFNSRATCTRPSGRNRNGQAHLVTPKLPRIGRHSKVKLHGNEPTGIAWGCAMRVTYTPFLLSHRLCESTLGHHTLQCCGQRHEFPSALNLSFTCYT